MTSVEVVSAAVVKVGADRKRRLLLGQRAAASSHALHWVTLGGKIEHGESRQEALARELNEEAYLTVPNHESATWWQGLADRWAPLYEHASTSTTGAPLRVRCFWVRSWAEEFNELRPGDGIIGLGWFTLEEVAALNMGPADSANRHALLHILNGWYFERLSSGADAPFFLPKGSSALWIQ